jgi:hypothetical protein
MLKLSKISLLRFALIVPAAIIGWYMGLMLGIAIYELGEITCPPEYVVSGACSAPWIPVIKNLAMAIGSGMAATLIVLFAYALAPIHKKNTALIALIVGAIVATVMVVFAREWIAFLFALSGGVITYLRLMRSAPSAATD